MKIPILVMTSDKYLKTLYGFTYLFNKYWSDQQEVDVYGFASPSFALPANFHFHSLGSQDSYPVNRWSDALSKTLSTLSADERPIIMLEDYWLNRPVNLDVVRALYLYMKSTTNVLKMDLMTDRLYAAGMRDYGHIGFIDLIYSPPATAYQMSLMTGIWNPELLSRFLIPGESPWDLEIYGTTRVANAGNDAMVLGTRQFPVRNILAHRGGDSGSYLTDGLETVDLRALQEMGVL